MSIGTRIFVHDTVKINIKRSLADDKQSKDTWDITITDDRGESVTIYCWGDDAILTEILQEKVHDSRRGRLD
jgi:hypothetical protein